MDCFEEKVVILWQNENNMEQTNLETKEMKLHRCKEDGMYGFADENGNVVIPCVWGNA